jgi:DNA replication protein DnaD
MKIWVFEIKDENKPIRCITEDGAKQLKQSLDQEGADYNLLTYPTVYHYLKDIEEWDDESVSDGEILDLCMETLEDLGI